MFFVTFCPRGFSKLKILIMTFLSYQNCDFIYCDFLSIYHFIHVLKISFLYPRSTGGGILLYLCPSKIFFVAFFSANIDGRNLIFGHNLHIGISYCGKRVWTRQIPTSCLPILWIFIHIEHIGSFFVAFFSATIDGRNLIFSHKLHIGTPYRGTHQIPTSWLSILLIFIHI